MSSNTSSALNFLTANLSSKLDLSKEVGRTTIITSQSSLAHQGGFYCETCDVLLKDSRAYTVHMNGRKHLKKLGTTQYVRRVSHDEVVTKLKILQQRWLQQNPQYIHIENSDNESPSDDRDVRIGLNGPTDVNLQSPQKMTNSAPEAVYMSVLSLLIQTQNEIDEFHQEGLKTGLTQHDIQHQHKKLKPNDIRNLPPQTTSNTAQNSLRSTSLHNGGDDNADKPTSGIGTVFTSIVDLAKFDIWEDVDKYMSTGRLPLTATSYVSLHNQIHPFDDGGESNMHDDEDAAEMQRRHDLALSDLDWDPWASEPVSNANGGDNVDDDDDDDDEDEFEEIGVVDRDRFRSSSVTTTTTTKFDEIDENTDQMGAFDTNEKQSEDQQVDITHGVDQGHNQQVVENQAQVVQVQGRQITFEDDDGEDWSDDD